MLERRLDRLPVSGTAKVMGPRGGGELFTARAPGGSQSSHKVAGSSAKGRGYF